MIQYILSWIGVAYGGFTILVAIFIGSNSSEILDDFKDGIVWAVFIAGFLLAVLSGIQVYPN